MGKEKENWGAHVRCYVLHFLRKLTSSSPSLSSRDFIRSDSIWRNYVSSPRRRRNRAPGTKGTELNGTARQKGSGIPINWNKRPVSPRNTKPERLFFMACLSNIFPQICLWNTLEDRMVKEMPVGKPSPLEQEYFMSNNDLYLKCSRARELFKIRAGLHFPHFHLFMHKFWQQSPVPFSPPLSFWNAFLLSLLKAGNWKVFSPFPSVLKSFKLESRVWSLSLSLSLFQEMPFNFLKYFEESGGITLEFVYRAWRCPWLFFPLESVLNLRWTLWTHGHIFFSSETDFRVSYITTGSQGWKVHQGFRMPSRNWARKCKTAWIIAS